MTCIFILCFASCVACSCILLFINTRSYGIFLIMQIKFCKFWHCDMHNWFMFCKFVIGIRHLSIKIIYTSRTGQMIVLYNNIIANKNKPDQKPDCIPCFLAIYPPVSIALSYTFQFALLDNVQLIPCGVLSLNRGAFYILI